MKRLDVLCLVAALTVSGGVLRAADDKGAPTDRPERPRQRQNEDRPRDGQRPQRPMRDGAGRDGVGPQQGQMLEELREEALRKFDKDGDGKLNEEERAAARDDFNQRRDAMAEKLKGAIDTNGDGELDTTEKIIARAALRELVGPPMGGPGGPAGPRGEDGSPPNPMRQRMIEPFDTDGDGKLSDEERANASDEVKARHQQMLDRFDADKDGKLSEEEHDAARAANRANRPNRN